MFQEQAGCTLQIHNSFSRSKGVSVPMPPLSEPNAPGLILTHGHAGKALKMKTDVWLSIDGGYKWTKVCVSAYISGDDLEGEALRRLIIKTPFQNVLKLCF